jgi:putative MFS transporter
VWFFFYFGIKGSLNFFSTRVVLELGWVPTDITIAVLSATVVGVFLIGLNGKLLDILGRKKAAVLIILVGVATSVATFLSNNFWTIIIFNVVATGCLNSFLMVGSTLTNELFPTQIRASAMAWANNIFGRIGQIIVPTFIGTLALWMTLGQAIAVAMVLPLISLLLILAFLPETSKRSLIENSAGEASSRGKDEGRLEQDAGLLAETKATTDAALQAEATTQGLEGED